MMSLLEQYRIDLNKRIGERQFWQRTAEKEAANLVITKEDVEAGIEAQAIAQQVAAAMQAKAFQAVSVIVTRCLAAVFDDPYEFAITFEQKRGRTEAHCLLKRNGVECDPMEAVGGGVVDVTAFALRIAAIGLSRPYGRRLIVLDEPFRFVSLQYRANVRLMLETLAEEMGFQIVIVTHMDELRTGNVIEVD